MLDEPSGRCLELRYRKDLDGNKDPDKEDTHGEMPVPPTPFDDGKADGVLDMAYHLLPGYFGPNIRPDVGGWPI